MRRRRGTAEFELLLTVMILGVVMLLTLGAIRLAMARMDTSQSAELEAFHRVAGGEATTDDVGLSPVEGYTGIRPGLPLRAFGPKVAKDVQVFQGSGAQSSSGSTDASTRTITISSTAMSISPSWPYPADPVGGSDYSANEQWFMDYINENHGSISGTLQLAPAWPP